MAYSGRGLLVPAFGVATLAAGMREILGAVAPEIAPPTFDVKLPELDLRPR